MILTREWTTDSDCDHKELELLHKDHTVFGYGTKDEHYYKVWRSGYLGYYKCRDCGQTSEVDSWGFRYK